MAHPGAEAPLHTFVWRAARFVYLLWGGMILIRLALLSTGRVAIPSWVWEWPLLAYNLMGPVGRGLLLGVGLAMALAAMKEVWELVDMLLLRFLFEREKRR